MSHYRENSSATHGPAAQQPRRTGNNNRLRTPVQPQFTTDTCHHPAVTATLTRSLATTPVPTPPPPPSPSRRCVFTQFFLPSHAQYKVPLRWLKNQRISFGVFFSVLRRSFFAPDRLIAMSVAGGFFVWFEIVNTSRK